MTLSEILLPIKRYYSCPFDIIFNETKIKLLTKAHNQPKLPFYISKHLFDKCMCIILMYYIL